MVYEGSHLLSFIAKSIGLPLDQFNFLFCQVVGILSGFLFRSYLKPCPQNGLKRHLVAILGGILLGHFCFGKQMWHLFCQAFVSYIFLVTVPRQYVHLVTFVFSIGYLSGLHIYNMIYEYGVYTLDISGPLMITTQKLTSLAFAYYDGCRKIEKLSSDQKSHMIKHCPHIIEFLSYIFNFQGIIVGPLSFYNDYNDFITGNNILKHQSNNDGNSDDNNNKIVQPSNKIPMLKKFLTFLLLGIVYFKVTLAYPISLNTSQEIIEKPVWYRLIFLYVSTSSKRAQYYMAWILAELVNNASGLGFNGYDSNGNAKWDLLTNVNIMKLELSTSMKVVFDCWNVQTSLWLRRICFDRLPTFKTIGVFVLSAFWHGFYPGYYISFVTASFAVYAGRGIRRKIRPFFQANSITKKIYSAVTWVGTALTLSYTVAPFDLYGFWICVKFYNSWYWWLSIIFVLLTFALPGGSSKTKKEPVPSNESSSSDTAVTSTQSTTDNDLNADEKKQD